MTRSDRPDTLHRMAIAAVRLGRNLVVTVYGETDAELGAPLVEIVGDRDRMQHLTPAQADELAVALTLAARHARGDRVPSALDRLLEPRRSDVDQAGADAPAAAPGDPATAAATEHTTWCALRWRHCRCCTCDAESRKNSRIDQVGTFKLLRPLQKPPAT